MTDLTPGTICWFVTGNGIGGASVTPVRVHARNTPGPAVLIETHEKARRGRVWAAPRERIHLTWEAAMDAAHGVAKSAAEVEREWSPAPDCDHCEAERQRADGLREAVLAACGVRLRDLPKPETKP